MEGAFSCDSGKCSLTCAGFDPENCQLFDCSSYTKDECGTSDDTKGICKWKSYDNAPGDDDNDEDGINRCYDRVTCDADGDTIPDLRDEDDDNVTLNLYWRQTPNDDWEFLEQQICQGVNFDTYTFEDYYFDCSDITPSGWDSQFKINGTDSYNFTDETAITNFTITRDNVTVTYRYGYNLNIVRGGSDSGLFLIEINDSDMDYVGVGTGV